MRRRWVRDPRVLWRDVADGVLLLAGGAQEPVLLSGTGALLWDRLVEPLTDEDLAARLAEVCGEQLEVVLADLEPALADLERCGAVRRQP